MGAEETSENSSFSTEVAGTSILPGDVHASSSSASISTMVEGNIEGADYTTFVLVTTSVTG